MPPSDWAMTNRQQTDELELIDLILGRLDAGRQEALRDRLTGDRDLAAHRQDVANTLAAVELLPGYDPPDDLVERTMSRIRQKSQTDALLAREEASAPPRRATFSLRDIGALAAVAGVLACVLLPVVRRASQVAAVGHCAAHAGQIGSAMTAYAKDNDGLLPSSGGGNNWLGASSERGTSAGLFKLVLAGYARPVVFRCSSGPDEGDGDLEVRTGAKMVDFPSARSVSYSYQHTFGSNVLRRNHPALVEVAESMAILADQTPVFPRGRVRIVRRWTKVGNSLNHGGTGQNVLYLDMHVTWVLTPAAGVDGNNIYLIDDVEVYTGEETPAVPTDTFLLPAYTRVDNRP